MLITMNSTVNVSTNNVSVHILGQKFPVLIHNTSNCENVSVVGFYFVMVAYMRTECL